MRRMGEIARARGLAGFTTDVSQKQQPMLMILYRNELHVESGLGDGAYHITLRFAPPPRETGQDEATLWEAMSRI